MAKKSKKLAARQAQLRDRSKKSRSHGPSGIPIPVPSESTIAVSNPVGISTSATEITEESTHGPSPAVLEPKERRVRARGIQVKPIETYFVQEIRRIGIISSGIFAILVALIFVMP
tara:strand:- start:611 stop:958 length:348 start_codon:yes stop_codon:yes gene_type:complete